nr:hypothetical protein Ade03nite_84750 [Actinoplanes derwentensis]
MTSSSSLKIADVESDVAVMPASSGQRGLWLSGQMGDAENAYAVHALWEITGHLDHDRMVRAVQEVVDRHEALRTSFLWDGGLFQLIHDAAPAPAPALVTATAYVDDATCWEIVGQPWETASHPLMRVNVIRRSPMNHVLAVAMHHLICDGPSVQILIRDLVRAYVSPGTVQADQPALHFADYAAWEAEWLVGEEYARQRLDVHAEWATAPPAINFPLGWDAGAAGAEVVRTSRLAPELSRRIDQLARDLRVTIFTLMLTMFSAVLHRWTGDRTIVIGTPISLRESADLDQTIGLLINTVPISTAWDEEASFADVVQAVQRSAGRALERRRCPFDQLVYDLRPPRAHGRAPVFQTFFSAVPEAEGAPLWPGFAVRQLPPPPASPKFELSCNVTVGDVHVVHLTADPRRFSVPVLEIFQRHLRVVIETLVDDPTTTVDRLPLVAAGGPVLADMFGLDGLPDMYRFPLVTGTHGRFGGRA